MNKQLSLFFCLFLSYSACFACNPEPGPQHFPVLSPPPRIQTGYFVVYNRLSHLISNNILSILPFENDEVSLTIIGTQDKGIMVFDGENWHFSGSEMFTFPETAVPAMVKVNEDSFYVSSPRGLYLGKVDGKRIDFEHINISNPGIQNILALAAKPKESNHLLLGSDKFVGALKNNVFQVFTLADNRSPTGFSALISCDTGDFAGCNQGVFAIDGNFARKIVAADGQNLPDWVTDFALAGKQLFITASNGVFTLQKEKGISVFFPGIWATAVAYSLPVDQPFAVNNTKPFVFGAVAEMRASSREREHAVAQYTSLQADYQAFTERWAGHDVIPQHEISAMYQRFHEVEALMSMTSQLIKAPLVKGLWIGTQDSGLIIMTEDGSNYHLTYKNSKLPSDEITAIASHKSGETWVGTANAGLMRYTKREISNSSKLSKLLDCEPTRVRIAGDLLLVGTRKNGMHMYSASTLDNLGHFNQDNTKGFHELVNDFAVDKNGNLWIAGDQGVIIWNGKKWKHVEFAKNLVVPEVPANAIEIDHNNRIFVAFGKDDMACNQIFVYNGEKLEGTDPLTLKKILKLEKKERAKAIDLHGLTGVYMREFDFDNATATLAVFEEGEAGQVQDLLNTEYYLLIGMKSGRQKIFDGQNFKSLSEKGTGKIGAIINYFQLPSGIIVIQGETGICEFDGEHYRLLESPATGMGFEITDMCPDQMNPETYLISYKSADGGGFARYQKGFWEKRSVEKPALSLAQDDKRIFLALPDGIYYLKE